MKNLAYFFAVVMKELLPPLSLSAQTIDELKTRAANGDAAAQYNLGNRYYFGEGVTKDYAEAIRWYRKAAEQGQDKAKRRLNEMGIVW